jgi:hypothetical protein
MDHDFLNTSVSAETPLKITLIQVPKGVFLHQQTASELWPACQENADILKTDDTNFSGNSKITQFWGLRPFEQNFQ